MTEQILLDLFILTSPQGEPTFYQIERDKAMPDLLLVFRISEQIPCQKVLLVIEPL